MKHNAFKKLYSRRGAAALIALLVFFLAALSGTIALTMAASNAGRYTHEKDDHQAYLSVVSAANLILDRLTGIEIVYEASNGSPEPEEVTVSINRSKGDLFLNDPDFLSILQTYSANKGAEVSAEFTLTAEGAPAMGEVYVSISLVSGTTFYFRLYSVDGNHRDYQMSMRVTAEFTSGVGNFEQVTGTKNQFIRKMYFDTEKAIYTVEENI